MIARLVPGALVLVMSHPPAVDAHDIYSDLVDAQGRSCCDHTDCRPAPYQVTETGVRMYVYGHWVAVPGNRIQYRALPGDPGETRGGHWCGSGHHPYLGPEDYVTRCAILPPNPSFARDAVPTETMRGASR